MKGHSWRRRRKTAEEIRVETLRKHTFWPDREYSYCAWLRSISSCQAPSHSKERSDRRDALGAALRVFSSSRPTRDLLRSLQRPYTGGYVADWDAGGCHVFAMALMGWINTRNPALDGRFLSNSGKRYVVTRPSARVVILCHPQRRSRRPCRQTRMVHVLTRVGEDLLDNMGWRDEVDLRETGPIKPYDPSAWRSANIPRVGWAIARLKALMFKALGDPAQWLGDIIETWQRGPRSGRWRLVDRRLDCDPEARRSAWKRELLWRKRTGIKPITKTRSRRKR